MNKQHLIEKLTELKINRGYYSLDGPFIDGIMLVRTVNHYTSNRQYDEWRVFDHERGDRYNEKIFYSEEEAYNDIYERFKKQGSN
jgi:glutamate synthase domain-containing protein 1